MIHTKPNDTYLLAEHGRDEVRDAVQGQVHGVERLDVSRAHTLLEVHRQHARPRLGPHNGGDLVWGLGYWWVDAMGDG